MRTSFFRKAYDPALNNFQPLTATGRSSMNASNIPQTLCSYPCATPPCLSLPHGRPMTGRQPGMATTGHKVRLKRPPHRNDLWAGPTGTAQSSLCNDCGVIFFKNGWTFLSSDSFLIIIRWEPSHWNMNCNGYVFSIHFSMKLIGKIKYVLQFLLNLELIQRPPIKLHLILHTFIQLKSELFCLQCFSHNFCHFYICCWCSVFQAQGFL